MKKEELRERAKNRSRTMVTAKGNFYSAISMSELNLLINRLDEPEVLSQEWIDNHAEHHEYIGYAGVPVDDLQNLLVPKQELPVIPQFVADWYEQEGSRMKWWNWFYKWGVDQSDSRTVLEKRALEWMQDFNEGLFVDIFRYGYEIEKEKLYYVIIPTKDTSGEYYYLDGFGGIDSAYDLKEVEHHTESFIRFISESLWQFAKEVTE